MKLRMGRVAFHSPGVAVKNSFGPAFAYKTPRLFLFSITHRCNSRCVMCNIWRQKVTEELSLNQIKSLLDDPAFESIEQVIITGGEPTLRKDLGLVAELLVGKCPALRTIQVSTNGLVPKLAVDACRSVDKACRGSNVKYSFLVSVDGVEEVHDRVRRVPDAFKHASETVDALRNLRPKLGFSLQVNCVLTRYNLSGFDDLADWSEQKDVFLSSQLAHDWRRFENENGVFHLTEEQKKFYLNMLWSKLKKSTGTYHDWMTYGMERLGRHRSLGCPFLTDAFSIHPDGNVYFCPNTEPVGNILEDMFSSIYYRNRNPEYVRRMKKRKVCQSCFQTCWLTNALERDLLHQIQYGVIKRILSLTG